MDNWRNFLDYANKKAVTLTGLLIHNKNETSFVSKVKFTERSIPFEIRASFLVFKKDLGEFLDWCLEWFLERPPYDFELEESLNEGIFEYLSAPIDVIHNVTITKEEAEKFRLIIAYKEFNKSKINYLTLFLKSSEIMKFVVKILKIGGN